MLSKNCSIASFESQISQLEQMQKREVTQLKLYLEEKERRMEEQQHRFLQETDGLKAQLGRAEQSSLSKEKTVAELQTSLQQITALIDGKMRELQMISR